MKLTILKIMTLLQDNDIKPLIKNKIIQLNEMLLIRLNALKNIKQSSCLLYLKDPFALIVFQFL